MGGMNGSNLSGGPWGTGTVNAQSLYGANAPGNPSPMHATAPGPSGAMGHAYFGIQLPVLIALGALAWWAWKSYD